MTPATTASASRATRKSQPTARAPQAAKKTPGSSVDSKKKADPPVAKKARAGRVAGSPAAGTAGTVRKAKVTPAKVVARPRPGAAAAPNSAKAAPRKPAAGSRQPAVKTTKVDKTSATKEMVNKAVTSTPRATKETKETKEKRAPVASLVAKADKSKPAPRKSAAAAGPYAQDEKFLTEQRQLLGSERTVYLVQASDLKAEADSLAQEREPGDVQFDEESGEGGTVTVDRERDLALSAQALAAVAEIDAALAKIANGTYGACERCGQPIPKPRLKALPYARLCVACKSGGLSRR